MNDFAADFIGATAQERFSIMMNERIGNLEESVKELRDLLSDIHGFLTTNVLFGVLSIPKRQRIQVDDPAFLDMFIDVVQKTRGVVVDAARCTIDNNLGDRHLVSVFIELKKPIVATCVSNEINEHIHAATGVGSAYLPEWKSVSIVSMHRAINMEKTPDVQIIVRKKGDSTSIRL